MIPPLFRHSIRRRLQRRCGAAHLLLKRLQPVMTRSARRDEPTTPPGAGHRLRAIGASILMGLVVSSAAAAECSEASPETFSAFLSIFSTSPAFVLSRTEFPLHERQWADDDWLEDSPAYTERWIARDAYARRPSLQAQAQQSGLTIDVAASTRTSATVELRDHLRFPVRAYHFSMDRGCWRLTDEDVFEHR